LPEVVIPYVPNACQDRSICCTIEWLTTVVRALNSTVGGARRVIWAKSFVPLVPGVAVGVAVCFLVVKPGID